MLKFHRSLPAALKHSGTWAGFGATLASMGQALDKPYATHAIVLGGICGFIATFIKSPNAEEEKSE